MKEIIISLLLSLCGFTLSAMKDPRDWIANPGEDTDEKLSELIVEAAQSDVALKDLKTYLGTMPDRSLKLEDITYQGAPLKKYYKRLPVTTHKHKEEVRRLLRERTLGKLFDAARVDQKDFDAFKNYFEENLCDIDKIMIDPLDASLGMLGEYLTSKRSGTSPGDRAYAQVFSCVEPYRSQPPDLGDLRHRIDVDSGNGSRAFLESLLKGRCFNIDLIYTQGNSGQTLGTKLDIKKSDPDVAYVLALDPIKNYRMKTLLYQRILDVLEGRAPFAVLKALYSFYPINIDTLDIDQASGKVSLLLLMSA